MEGIVRKVFIVAVGILLFFVSIAGAGVWTRIRGFTLKEVKPDAVYALAVIGENVRVYEFTTRTEPKAKCVVIFSEQKPKVPVMQCWPLH